MVEQDSPEFKALQSQFSYLVSCISIGSILPKARAILITVDDYDDCKAERTDAKQAEKLMGYVEKAVKADPGRFHQFVAILENIGQKAVAQRLRDTLTQCKRARKNPTQAAGTGASHVAGPHVLSSVSRTLDDESGDPPSELTRRQLSHDRGTGTQQHDNSQQSSTKLQPQHGGSSNLSTNSVAPGDRSSMLRNIVLCVLIFTGVVIVAAGVSVIMNQSNNNKQQSKNRNARSTKCHKIVESSDVYLYLKQEGFSVTDTYNFGLFLKLKSFEMENLKEECGGKNNYDFFNKVVDKWYKSTKPPVCWETVYNALVAIPNQPLAHKVKQKYMNDDEQYHGY